MHATGGAWVEHLAWRPTGEPLLFAAAGRRLAAILQSGGTIAHTFADAPKTISAHVTHILTKLGAARRAEIGAWCATVRQDTPR